MSGVIQTTTGYAGGTFPDPTYKNFGDHTEVVQLKYNPAIISFQELVLYFFNSHNPNRKRYRDREYISLILYHNQEQLETAVKSKKKLEQITNEMLQTEISPYNSFTIAPDRQQKWHIKRNKQVLAYLQQLYPSEDRLTRSTLAARLNAIAKGFGSSEKLIKEMDQWQIDEQLRRNYKEIVNHMRASVEE